MKYKDDYKEYDEYIEDDEYMDDGKYEDYDTKRKPHKKMIEVEEVIGIGSDETITEICVPLCPPAFAIEESLITREVEFDILKATKDMVFINGRIVKDIPYKTRVKIIAPSCTNVSKATFGDLRHVTVEVPFALCIKIPGAYKGAKVVVLDYEVNSVEIPNHTPCIPNSCVAACDPRPLDRCERRLFKSITEKDCVSVKVKVVKDTIICLPHKDNC